MGSMLLLTLSIVAFLSAVTFADEAEFSASSSGSSSAPSEESNGNGQSAKNNNTGPMSEPGPIIGLVLGTGLSLMGLIVLWLKYRVRKDREEKGLLEEV